MNSQFPPTGATLGGPLTVFQAPRSFIMFFSKSSSKTYCTEAFWTLLSLGMLSKKQWALRPSHAAVSLPRWQGGWPAAARAALVTKCDATKAVFSERSRDEFLGKISWAFFLSFPYLERHMAQPTAWKTEVNNTDADFANVKICHKFPSVHIWTNMSINM